MLSTFDFDVDDALAELESLSRRVPEAVPKAVEAMSSILVKRLKEAAPEKSGQFKRSIGRTKVKLSRAGNSYQVVFIKNRGENDENVHTALALEYGNSRQKASPFWRNTVNDSRDEMHEAAKGIIEKAINNK